MMSVRLCRFLVISVIEIDNREDDVVCMEDPENGIPPARIPMMLSLLQDMTSDVVEKIESAKPPLHVSMNA